MGDRERSSAAEFPILADAAGHLESYRDVEHRILLSEYVYGGKLQLSTKPDVGLPRVHLSGCT